MHIDELFDDADGTLCQVVTKKAGPSGMLPLTDKMLRQWPSGHLFGLTQNAGMGWSPKAMMGPQFLILSTQGGMRAADGQPIALGYHTGHFEVGLLVQAATAKTSRESKSPVFPIQPIESFMIPTCMSNLKMKSMSCSRLRIVADCVDSISYALEFSVQHDLFRNLGVSGVVHAAA